DGAGAGRPAPPVAHGGAPTRAARTEGVVAAAAPPAPPGRGLAPVPAPDHVRLGGARTRPRRPGGLVGVVPPFPPGGGPVRAVRKGGSLRAPRGSVTAHGPGARAERVVRTPRGRAEPSCGRPGPR